MYSFYWCTLIFNFRIFLNASLNIRNFLSEKLSLIIMVCPVSDIKNAKVRIFPQ